MSLTAQRRLAEASAAGGRVAERLASGQRINRASDDAAGLAIATSLHADTRIFTQALRNVNDGISLVNIAHGAIAQLGSITTRIAELAEQAATGSYHGPQRLAMNKEVTALVNEYNRIIETTSFNGVGLLDGTDDVTRIQAGVGVEQSLELRIGRYLGNPAGDGSYQAPSTPFGASSVDGISLVDLTGDGVLDAAFAVMFARLRVVVGNADGTFGAPRDFDTVARPSEHGSADLNNDGRPDLFAVGSHSTSIGVLLGNGDGSFQTVQSYVAGAAPNDILAKDFNGDGWLDLAAASQTSVNVFLNNGDGTFRLSSSMSSGAYTVTTADFNEDGIEDIVAGDGTLSLFVGNGDGTFKAAQPLRTGGGWGVQSGDFNGDGYQDIASATRFSSHIEILLGNGNGTFKPAISLSTFHSEPYRIRVEDLNGDNKADLIVQHNTSNALGVFFGNGDGTFAAVKTLTPPAGVPSRPAIADVNRDGVPDIAYVSSNLGAVMLGNADPAGRRNNLLPPKEVYSITEARETLEWARTHLQNLGLETGNLGALQSRLQTASATLGEARLQYDAARGRIDDADIAHEAAIMAATTILQRTAQSVLAQANQQPALALTLLGR